MDTSPTSGLDSGFAQELGRQLRALRERRRESVEDVGRRLLMSANQIRALEDGEGEPFYGPRYHLQAARKYAAMSGLDFDALEAEFAPRGAQMRVDDEGSASGLPFLAGETREGPASRTTAGARKPSAGSRVVLGAAVAAGLGIVAIVVAMLLPDRKAGQDGKVTSEVALSMPASGGTATSGSSPAQPAAGDATPAQPSPAGSAPSGASTAAAPATSTPATPVPGASTSAASTQAAAAPAASAPANTAPAATPPSTAPAASASSGAPSAAQNGSAPARPPASARTAEPAAKSAGAVSKPGGPGSGELHVTFNGEAWMQVVKRDGTRQTRRYRAKQSVTLQRKDLQAVVISDWKRATAVSEGRKIDLSRHRPRDSNQARLVGTKLRTLGE